MDVALYLEDLLRDMGCGVAKEPRVATGLQILEAEEFGGVILDVNIFGSPVDPLVRELRSRGIPFAFVTGHRVTHIPVEYSDCPILAKPADQETFAHGVATLVMDAKAGGMFTIDWCGT